MPAASDTWSDSDDDYVDGEKTDVLLGLPDGKITSPGDLLDPAVSRAGGVPAFLPGVQVPSSTISCCNNCQEPTELLLQLWCPFEQSPMDRVLYIWGCARSVCQGKSGSVRAHRCLKHNPRFAAKLEKQRAAKAVQKETKEVPRPSNPFSMSGDTTQVPQLFSANNLFDQPPSTNEGVSEAEQDEEDVEDEPPATEKEIQQLAEAMSSAKISDTPLASWLTAPSYEPVYLSSVSEYIPRETSARSRTVPKPEQGVSKEWKSEEYESSGTDQVFDNFSRRVAHEGRQCLRYELSGVPLPYHSDPIYKRLFPGGSVRGSTKHRYDSSWIPPCPICGGPRAFECQLMPHLISTLKSAANKQTTQSERERKLELERVLRKGVPDQAKAGSEKTGMEWGTCMVFACVNDCRFAEAGSKEEVTDCWREEYVVVQWEG